VRRQTLLTAALAAALLLSAGIVSAQSVAPWLHVRVTESGENGTRVAVNLPLSLVQVFADIAENEIRKELAGGGTHLHLGHEIQIADLRRAWNELRVAGDAELVEIEEDDQHVKISRLADKIIIEFAERGGDGNGRVEVPISVVDALLSGDGEELNIRAAIDQLIATTAGEIVFVEDQRTTVRVWIE